MTEIIDLNKLGHTYTISVRNKKQVKSIKLIHEEEILNSVFGEYEEGHFKTIKEYLGTSTLFLTGFVKGPEYISWYTPGPKGEIDLKQLAYTAISEGNDIVIVQKDYESIDKQV